MDYEYTPEKKFTNVDGDIAAVGATDLGFTVGYDQTNIISEDGNINNYPVAIDQLVLFNRNAFDEVKMKNFQEKILATNVKYHMVFLMMGKL